MTPWPSSSPRNERPSGGSQRETPRDAQGQIQSQPTYKPIDKRVLEERLVALGITDKQLLSDTSAFREMRAALVHEKARPSSKDTSVNYTAQDEAAKAIALMERVESALRALPPVTGRI